MKALLVALLLAGCSADPHRLTVDGRFSADERAELDGAAADWATMTGAVVTLEDGPAGPADVFRMREGGQGVLLRSSGADPSFEFWRDVCAAKGTPDGVAVTVRLLGSSGKVERASVLVAVDLLAGANLTLRQTARHELGHVLGLPDAPGTGRCMDPNANGEISPEDVQALAEISR